MAEKVGFIFGHCTNGIFMLGCSKHYVKIYAKVIGGLNILGNVPGT